METVEAKTEAVAAPAGEDLIQQAVDELLSSPDVEPDPGPQEAAKPVAGGVVEETNNQPAFDVQAKLAELAAREEKERLAQIIKERDELKSRLAAEKPAEQEKKEENLLKTLRENPDEVAKLMGLKDDQALAKFIWSKKLGEDAPEDMNSADAFMRLQERLNNVENENKRFREQVEQERKKAAEERQQNEFKSQLESVVDDSFGHVSHFLKNKKDETLNEALLLAEELRESTGIVPSAERIMRELDVRIDKAREDRISALRSELALWEKKDIETRASEEEPPTKSAPTLTSGTLAGATEKVDGPKSEEERIAEAVAMLEAMKSG